MRELKTDIRTVRALRAEQSLPKQSSLQAPDGDAPEVNSSAESVVVELPNRKLRTTDETLEETPPSKPKQRRTSKQKAQSTAKQKPPATLVANRTWEVSQKATGETESPGMTSNRLSQFAPEVAHFPIPDGTAATVEPSTNAEQGARSPYLPSRQSKPLHALRLESSQSPLPSNRIELEQVESQMRRINQLSTELETAMVELKAIANDMNRDTRSAYPKMPVAPGELPGSSLESQAQRIPHLRQPQQASGGSTPPATFLKAEQEAAATAQTIRHLANRERALVRGLDPLATGGVHRSPTRRRTLKFYLNQFQRFIQLPQNLPALMADTAVWVLSALALRVGLKYLMLAFPPLQIPLTLLMITPAILAAYLAIFVPQSGVISGYRLFLVMIGFWLGR